MALSGKSRPNQRVNNVRCRTGLTHTQKVSHVLLDLADLVRRKIPDIFRGFASEAEIADGDLGTLFWLREKGFCALATGQGLSPNFICSGGIVS